MIDACLYESTGLLANKCQKLQLKHIHGDKINNSIVINKWNITYCSDYLQALIFPELGICKLWVWVSQLLICEFMNIPLNSQYTIQNNFLIWISCSFKKGARDNTIIYFDQTFRFSDLWLILARDLGRSGQNKSWEQRTEREHVTLF